MSRPVLLALLVPALATAAPPEGNRAGGAPQLEADLAECEADVDSLLEQVEDLEAASALTIATPDQGGAATSVDGAATVQVPPLAVVGAPLDLTIELVEAPANDRLLSAVYDFGPDATTFERDVTVCLDVDTERITDDANTCLAFQTDDAQWKCEDPCLEQTGEGTYCGTTSHFTNFAILLSGSSDDTTCDTDDTFLDGRTGGVVSSEDGLAFISVPPLSFPEPTPVYVDLVERPIVDVPRASGVYDIGPDGLFFRTPATVCLTAPDAPLTACLGYFDETTRTWECEDKCLDRSGETVCGTTSHLTNFAVLLQGGLTRDECVEN